MRKGQFVKGNHQGKEVVDLIGRRFGKLTVICRATPNTSRKNAAHWLCRCDCGNTATYRSDMLQTKFKSCGCIMQGKKLPPGEASRRKKFFHVQASARRRAIPFHITLEQFKTLASQPCHYCGCLPSQEFKGYTRNGSFIYNGLDRLDSTQGYLLSNCVSACKFCNYAKQSLSYEDFLDLVECIYRHRVTLRRTQQDVG